MFFINRLQLKIKRKTIRKRLSENGTLRGGVIFDDRTSLEGKNLICNNSVISGSKIGKCSYIGYDSYIPNTMIGRYSSIASNVRVVAGNHPTRNYVSTHGAFYSKDFFVSYVEEQRYTEFSYVDQEERYYVQIGNDVWVGSNVLILNGVKIGNGAVIAAGAVVVNDVEPYSIVGGVPAKVIRKRFNDDDIRFLEELCWWNWDEQMIIAYSDSFKDIRLLKDKYSNNAGK